MLRIAIIAGLLGGMPKDCISQTSPVGIQTVFNVMSIADSHSTMKDGKPDRRYKVATGSEEAEGAKGKARTKAAI
jgi:hypothetical protein